MPSRFVAPKRVETLEDVRKALQAVQEQFDANGISRARQQLVTADTTLRAGEFVRLSPRQGGTIFAKLPKATAENIGTRIEISIERPNGTVKVSAQSPDTVSGLKTASFTLAGLVILESNGVDQWVLFNQLPTNSPAAATNFFFSNANGVTFGTVGSTVTASVSVASTQGSIRIAAGTTSVLSSLFSFSNLASGVSFGMDTNGVLTATANMLGQVAVPLTTQNSVSQLLVANSPTITWSASAGTAGRMILAAHAFGPAISHVGVTSESVTNVTRFAFSDTPTVSWTVSTGAGGATILASAAGAAGGGVALADIYGHTVSSGTVLMSASIANTTVSNLWTNGTSSNNVIFGLTGQTLTAVAFLAAADATTGAGQVFTRINFLDSNGVIWGVSASQGSAGTAAGTGDRFLNVTASMPNAIQRVIAGTGDFTNNTIISFVDSNGISWGNSDVGSVNVITASYSPLFISAVIDGGGPGVFSSGSVVMREYTGGGGQTQRQVFPRYSSNTLQFAYDPPRAGGQWNRITHSAISNYSSFNGRPYFFQPFVGDPILFFGRGDDHAMGNWYVGHSGQTATSVISNSSTGGWSATVRLGLYSVVNGTAGTLTLVNSASRTFAIASSATSSQLGGSRWIQFNQTDWSASSGLSAGQWWVAVLVSQSGVGGSADGRFGFGGDANAQFQAHSGLVGVNNVNLSRANPFAGYFTASTMTALPVSAVSTNFAATAAASAAQMGFIPAFSIQAVMAAAWG